MNKGVAQRPRAAAPMLMLAASLLFALMGVCVKWAAVLYPAGEIVLYRSLVGAVFIIMLARWRGVGLRTRVPAMHFWRSASGVAALVLWFYALGGLPLATAMTLNYMSSVWMALFLIGGSVMLGQGGIDGRLVAVVGIGFAGVALVLRPTIDQQQLWHGLTGLISGVLAAMAYLQLTVLGRAGEPEERVVFYFSLGGAVVGLLSLPFTGGLTAHTGRGALLLLAIGLLAAVAQLMMTRAYTIGRTLSNATLQYSGIAFGFVFGVLLFDEVVTTMALAGMALIVVAGIGATLLRSRSVAVTASDDGKPPTQS
jgi:drug/metabolite transporter (DMT)-like permease